MSWFFLCFDYTRLSIKFFNFVFVLFWALSSLSVSLCICVQVSSLRRPLLHSFFFSHTAALQFVVWVRAFSTVRTVICDVGYVRWSFVRSFFWFFFSFFSRLVCVVLRFAQVCADSAAVGDTEKDQRDL